MQHIQTAIANVDTVTQFADWGPDANPLIRYFKHHHRHRRITLRRTLWIAFTLGLMFALWATWDVLTLSRDNDIGAAALILYIVSWPVLIVSPVLSATTAARHTSHAVRPERYDLVYVSPLPNETLVSAHIFRAIYHVRRQWALLIAMMPLTVIYTFYVSFETASNFYAYAYPYIAPSYWQVVGPTLWVLAIVLGFWGLNVLGTVFGVRMGVFRRDAFMSTLAAVGGMLLIVLSPCACCMCATWTLSNAPPDFLGDLLLYVFPFVFMIGPWIVAWKLAEHTALVWPRE